MAQVAPAFAKRAAEYDREASFPWQNWEDLKEAGLLGICVPREAGGLGGDFVTYALASEEPVSYTHLTLPTIYSV